MSVNSVIYAFVFFKFVCMSNVISIALDCILFICFVICMMGQRPIVLNKILSFVICHLSLITSITANSKMNGNKVTSRMNEHNCYLGKRCPSKQAAISKTL